jgi:hypothetical protein
VTTVLTDEGPVGVTAGPGAEGELWLSARDTEAVSGWTMKAEGLCRGEICVPVPDGQSADYVRDNLINLPAFWRRMEKPLAHDRNVEVWAFGESAAERAGKLRSLDAPDFALSDLAGKEHSLSEYRGKKVFLATWASW